MAEFVRAAGIEDLPPGSARSVEVRGRAFALYNVGGSVYATANTCPHRGGPLGDGSLDGATITCPWHGFLFEVTSGRCLTNPGLGVACHRVRIEGPDILVEV